MKLKVVRSAKEEGKGKEKHGTFDKDEVKVYVSFWVQESGEVEKDGKKEQGIVNENDERYLEISDCFEVLKVIKNKDAKAEEKKILEYLFPVEFKLSVFVWVLIIIITVVVGVLFYFSLLSGMDLNRI